MVNVLSDDDLADIEGDAGALLRAAKLEDDERVDVVALARRLVGSAPMLARSGPEACLIRVREEWRVVVRRSVPAARARWLVCHEIAEHHYARIGYRGVDVEARCDALGAALVLPRRLAQLAIREHAHRVSRLAASLGVTQALVLLRVGEVTRRPVLLERRPGVRVARGAPFDWASTQGAVHPVKLSDEGRWGWMLRRQVEEP